MTINDIRSKIKYYKDFPKEGIIFLDLLPILADSEVFTYIIHEINTLITSKTVVAPEARGFLFAAPLLAIPSGIKGLIPFRKGGKLPHTEGDLVKIPIIKEYGDDSLYFRKSDVATAVLSTVNPNMIEVTLFDDVLATGGTAEGMAKALHALKLPSSHGEISVRISEFIFIAEIESLGARKRLEQIAPVKSLLIF